MFARNFARATGLVKNSRHFQGNPALRDVKPVPTPTNAASNTARTPDPEQVIGAKMKKCTEFDKWILVWGKKYSSKDQVPDKVTLDVFHKAQSKVRIRAANIMMIGTLLGCVWAVVTGKQAMKEGRTITKQNMDWHAEINKEYKANLAASKSS